MYVYVHYITYMSLLLVSNLVSHDVDTLKVSSLVNGAGGGPLAHPRDRGEPDHLVGDAPPGGDHVDVQAGQDEGVVPVERVVVRRGVLRPLPLLTEGAILGRGATTKLPCCRLTRQKLSR